MSYVELLKPYVFGASAKLGERLTGIQTPGGTGALRLGAELIHAASPEARIYVGTPTWPNHAADFRRRGPAGRDATAYIDLATQRIDFEAVVSALSGARAGDVAAAARLLPQSRRHRFLERAVEGDRRASSPSGRSYPSSTSPIRASATGSTRTPPRRASSWQAWTRRSSPIPATRTLGSIAIASARSTRCARTPGRRGRPPATSPRMPA